MKSIETLLNIAMNQNFATPKKLNRSTKAIPQTIVEQLENRLFTCEMIEDLKKQYPIYHYKSCITIHGNWGEVNTSRIGRYKNIHQNQNGSLEVYYSAIDRQKIDTIRKNLESVNCQKYYFLENSTDRVFRYSKTITKETAQELRDEFLNETNRIKNLNIFGTVHCYISPKMWGGADIVLDIRPLAIPETQVLNVCYMLAGISPENWHQTQLNVERERAIQQEINNAEQAKRDEERRQENEKQKEKLTLHYLPKIEHLKPGTIHEGIIVTIKEERFGNDLNFVYSKIDGKGAFGKTKWSTAKSPEFIADPNQLNWVAQKQAPIKEIKAAGRLL